MIRSGEFGHKEYFQELCDTVDGGDDFYLVGNDFASYLEAQVRFQVPPIFRFSVPFSDIIQQNDHANVVTDCCLLSGQS